MRLRLPVVRCLMNSDDRFPYVGLIWIECQAALVLLVRLIQPAQALKGLTKISVDVWLLL